MTASGSENATGTGGDAARVVELPARIGVAEAESLHESLRTALQDGVDVRLDGSGVERMTTPGVQVMLVAARAQAKAKRRFVVAAPSEAMNQAFAELGLAAEYQAWREGA